LSAHEKPELRLTSLCTRTLPAPARPGQEPINFLISSANFSSLARFCSTSFSCSNYFLHSAVIIYHSGALFLLFLSDTHCCPLRVFRCLNNGRPPRQNQSGCNPALASVSLDVYVEGRKGWYLHALCCSIGFVRQARRRVFCPAPNVPPPIARSRPISVARRCRPPHFGISCLYECVKQNRLHGAFLTATIIASKNKSPAAQASGGPAASVPAEREHWDLNLARTFNFRPE
jgi:hypothetical protein